MEKLKSVVPNSLQKMISESTPEDLPSTCSALLDFFLALPLFHSVVGELTDPARSLCRKNTGVSLDFKRQGNECFSAGDYAKALSFYSQALQFAPMGKADDVDKNLVATLYVNRASSLHKMGLLAECIRDCNRAVELLPSYSKAWYRRGMANASLENYENAVSDLDIAMNMENSVGGKSRIKDELDMIINQSHSTTSSRNKQDEKNLDYSVEPSGLKLKCVLSPTKGRGLASSRDIPQASLVHSEEPYAAIILKNCRTTHCHFCFNELPADTVPCSSCSLPLYCSQHCQGHAVGKTYMRNLSNNLTHENTSNDLEGHNASISQKNSYKHPDSILGLVAEHRHECGGKNWSAVLPAEIILAGRIVAKSIAERGRVSRGMTSAEPLELSHNYVRMPSDSKLDLHIYSVVLAHCLQQYYGTEFPLNGSSTSEVVVLVSQIRVNSMAVVHMKSSDTCDPLRWSNKVSPVDETLTNCVEQVRVGQAIYQTGSLFNHSCQPKIHAYFLSRTLFVRSTEFVEAGYPLELSYRPQVGQWDLYSRHKLLEDQYSFKCQCSGCSDLNLSDLVINSFSCVKPDCPGVVVDSCKVHHEFQEDSYLQDVATSYSLERPLPVDKLEREEIDKVARLLGKQKEDSHVTDPGYCLNCGSYRDLTSSQSIIREALKSIKRLRDAMTLRVVPPVILSDALRSLNILRSILHGLNKYIAQTEDNLAEAFSLNGDFLAALEHCKASVLILEKLYHPNHIVIGNELVKLASIQLCLGDHASALDTIKRLDTIFSLHYGSHSAIIFPYLESLKRECDKLA